MPLAGGQFGRIVPPRLSGRGRQLRRIIGPPALVEPRHGLCNHGCAGELLGVALSPIACGACRDLGGCRARFQRCGKLQGCRVLGVGSVAFRVRLPKLVESLIDSGARRGAIARKYGEGGIGGGKGVIRGVWGERRGRGGGKGGGGCVVVHVCALHICAHRCTCAHISHAAGVLRALLDGLTLFFFGDPALNELCSLNGREDHFDRRTGCCHSSENGDVYHLSRRRRSAGPRRRRPPWGPG